MNTNSETITPEWSHIIDADEIRKEPTRLTIAPDAQAIKDLLHRLTLEDLKDFKADLILTREQGGMVVNIKGHMKGHITQSCVVSLDPVESDVDSHFEAWFADPGQAIALSKVKHDKQIKTSGETPILEEHEDPEPIINGQIDLGELVTQHLSLTINPYPHAQGVHYEYGDDEPQKVPEAFKTNPFAALKNWRNPEG